MEATAPNFYTNNSACPRSTTIMTTLYELIEALQEEVEPNEEWLVVMTVLDLLHKGKVKFLHEEV